MRRTINNIPKLKKDYEKLKLELSSLKSRLTLESFSILSEAFKIGQKMYGRRFTYADLARDFDISKTTATRIMSLKKANKKTWKLIDSGKISAHKVSLILLSKSIHYQDEYVDMIISHNLSTVGIRNLKSKPGSLHEVNMERARIAINEGYSTKQSAAFTYKCAIGKLQTYLDMPPGQLTEGSKKEIVKRLGMLRKKIDKAIQELNGDFISSGNRGVIYETNKIKS